MKIGFEGKRATNNATGLGNYSRNAINTLSATYPDNEYVVYSANTSHYLPQLSATLERPNVVLRGPRTSLGRAVKPLWRSYGLTKLLRSDRIDLFHGLSGELPLNIRRSGIPSVVTIHDLIFLRHPEYYRPIDRKIYDYKFRHAVADATRVIAISKTTRDDIVRFYGTDPDKIDVIYQGCNPRFNPHHPPAETDEVRRIYGIPGPYIVSVGTVEERKNQLLALRALPSLPSSVSLVVVGRQTPYADLLRRYAAENGLTDRLIFVDHADFRHLPAIYAGALLASYTSLAEGFGLPVIEAINCGTPVIVATGSCLEEAGGPDTPAVAPNDVEAFVSHARAIIDEPALRRHIVTASQLYTKRFAARSFAENLMKTYLKALNA